MLAQINVHTDINAVPAADFFDKYVIPGRFVFTIFWWTAGGAFPTTAQSIYMLPVGENAKANYA